MFKSFVDLLLLASFLLARSTAPAATKANARVVLKQSYVVPTGPNLQCLSQEAVFVLGTKDNYAIDCRGGVDTSDPKKPYTPGNNGACLGMTGPVCTGWYGYGFFNFVVNDQEASTTAANSLLRAEQGRRAILDCVWHMNAANVRIRFLGLPGRDLLFCEMTIDPRQAVTALVLKTSCFPAFFTGAYGHREQARFIRTSSQLIREAEHRSNIRLDPKDNWWLLYGDDYFDVAKTKESDGPCAMMVLPEDVGKITIHTVDYEVAASLAIAPATRKVRMAFWKMKDKTNAAAVDYFRSNGESIRKELAALDFAPRCARVFDLAGMTADVEHFTRSKSVGIEFQKNATEVLDWIKAHSTELANKADSVTATECKLQLLNKYSHCVDGARLAEILASLDNN